jgi:hypothetical protein
LLSEFLNGAIVMRLKSAIEIVEGSPKNQSGDQRPARYRLKFSFPSIQKPVWPDEVV